MRRPCIYAFLLASALALAAACSQLGLAPAPTFHEKLAYAYSTVSAMRTSATQALEQKRITPADAGQVLTLTDQARSALDRATALAGTDITGGVHNLALATGILEQVSKFLQSRGVK